MIRGRKVARHYTCKIDYMPVYACFSWMFLVQQGGGGGLEAIVDGVFRSKVARVAVFALGFGR